MRVAITDKTVLAGRAASARPILRIGKIACPMSRDCTAIQKTGCQAMSQIGILQIALIIADKRDLVEIQSARDVAFIAGKFDSEVIGLHTQSLSMERLAVVGQNVNTLDGY